MPAPSPAPSYDLSSRHTRLRRAANWLNLSTPLGLAVARAGGARVRPGPRGLYLADHYRWSFPAAVAFTVGDVVITRHDVDELLARRPQLLEHEEAHSRQWMACLGLPFLPLYGVSVAWSWARTGDRAARSVFERHAGLAKGGYRDVPVRRLRPVLAAGARRAVTALRGRRSADIGTQIGTRIDTERHRDCR